MITFPADVSLANTGTTPFCALTYNAAQTAKSTCFIDTTNRTWEIQGITKEIAVG